MNIGAFVAILHFSTFAYKLASNSVLSLNGNHKKRRNNVAIIHIIAVCSVYNLMLVVKLLLIILFLILRLLLWWLLLLPSLSVTRDCTTLELFKAAAGVVVDTIEANAAKAELVRAE
uniref:Uncharacterized protein n=1 Tax=Glossina austeni TaxID=7395 RepID=A0A1A9VG11_GLOAU